MRPVDEATKIVPLVHPANLHPVSHTKRNAISKIDVVGN